MATIIKNKTQARTTGVPLREVAYDLTDFSGQAENYLDQVRAEAMKIVQKAKQEAIAIRSQAEEAGRKAAHAAVEKILDEKVAQQMRTLSPALAAAVGQIVDSRSSWERHWEGAIVDLACAISARIVRREISATPEISLDWIRESLELAGGAAEISLHLNPTDLTTLRDQIQRLTEILSPAAPARLVPDETITSGGCRVETEFGTVDMQLETQLKRLAEEMS
ncbi:FliH/SctL family protein [Bythopirellula goksoeyrii]|uniref:Flagellar assembly protein FliH n=1 Tax=Bythopirellula goksoeyrii TaxID=1400387 RepID=A0A5B9Q257_9BACT|nr:FliH/SctL family protein [Bythopirellula goksoeyrii]QEG33054.1 Yop proteins translocation protein L [Bythopirellula goksoeyrii]